MIVQWEKGHVWVGKSPLLGGQMATLGWERGHGWVGDRPRFGGKEATGHMLKCNDSVGKRPRLDAKVTSVRWEIGHVTVSLRLGVTSSKSREADARVVGNETKR